MRAFRTGHARGDRRQYQNAFESFTKNENANIEKGDGRTRVRLRRVRRAMRGHALPDDHRHHRNRGDENADPKNDAPRPIDLAQNSRTHDRKLTHP